jgi:hypothetical protein
MVAVAHWFDYFRDSFLHPEKIQAFFTQGKFYSRNFFFGENTLRGITLAEATFGENTHFHF